MIQYRFISWHLKPKYQKLSPVLVWIRAQAGVGHLVYLFFKQGGGESVQSECNPKTQGKRTQRLNHNCKQAAETAFARYDCFFQTSGISHTKSGRQMCRHCTGHRKLLGKYSPNLIKQFEKLVHLSQDEFYHSCRELQ